MRRFAGHAALAVAAFASLATSKARWHVEATPPPTKIDDALGTRAVIEASQDPEVDCVTPQFPYLRAALLTHAGTRYEYLCPPGASFREATIDGTANGCGKPEAPDGAFIRYVELKPVKMWRAEAGTTFQLATEKLDSSSTYAYAFAEVGGAVISTIDTAPAPGADPMVERPRVSTAGVNRFEITVNAPGTESRRAWFEVHAVGYGICGPDCKPGEITVGRAQ